MTPTTGATGPAAHTTKVHPCSLRPVPASVLEQREVALESAFGRALSEVRDEAEIVVNVRSNANQEAVAQA
jgi:hypothetical protein